MEYEFFLPKDVLPKGFTYPDTYRKFVSGVLPDLDPWHFFYSHLEFRFRGLKQRYPARNVVPFARRGDNDDVACFETSELSNNTKVIIIHDWASEGWEQRREYPNFLAWLELAKKESKDWETTGGHYGEEL